MDTFNPGTRLRRRLEIQNLRAHVQLLPATQHDVQQIGIQSIQVCNSLTLGFLSQKLPCAPLQQICNSSSTAPLQSGLAVSERLHKCVLEGVLGRVTGKKKRSNTQYLSFEKRSHTKGHVGGHVSVHHVSCGVFSPFSPCGISVHIQLTSKTPALSSSRCAAPARLSTSQCCPAHNDHSQEHFSKSLVCNFKTPSCVSSRRPCANSTRPSALTLALSLSELYFSLSLEQFISLSGCSVLVSVHRRQRRSATHVRQIARFDQIWVRRRAAAPPPPPLAIREKTVTARSSTTRPETAKPSEKKKKKTSGGNGATCRAKRESNESDGIRWKTCGSLVWIGRCLAVCWT